MSDTLVLEAADVRLTVSAADGGRMASLIVRGHELLVTAGPGPIVWGAYPFAPFAGRIRDGRFRFDGLEVALPLNLPPNAIHGTVFERAWRVEGPDTMSTDLGPDWPFRGRVTQQFVVDADGLDVTLRLEAEDRMPATLGWHPWFVRRMAGADCDVELRFEADQMYQRDSAGLPDGHLVTPGPGPWDDCFVGLRSAPRLTWPGHLALELRSTADHWVVYTELAHALCVEPQTGPPDAVNLGRTGIVERGDALEVEMSWTWWSPRESGRGFSDPPERTLPRSAPGRPRDPSEVALPERDAPR
jgi:aldose 1-epimerase